MTAVALVLKFGLVGVADGTLVAMVYRTCYLAWYISRNVINRSLWAFAKHLCVDACSIALFVGLVYNVLGPIQELHATTYFGWSILALKTIALGIPAIATVNTMFYYPKITRYIKKQ